MDKRNDGLAGAMREIAEQRDNRLGESGGISGDRLEQLQAFLAENLPVETALSAAAQKRDKLLSLPEPRLPQVVHAALVEQVRSVRAGTTLPGVVRQFAAWLVAPSLPGRYGTAAMVAACVVIAFGLLHLSRSSNPGTRISNKPLLSSIENVRWEAFPENVFGPSSDHLTLGVNRIQLASLEPPLFTINRAFLDFERADRVLPLDLPIRHIRLDVEAVRTP